MADLGYMLPTTSILTSRVFVRSAEVMRRTDARATADVEVALMGSTTNSITELEIRTLIDYDRLYQGTDRRCNRRRKRRFEEDDTEPHAK
jgi:hypothetical protein